MIRVKNEQRDLGVTADDPTGGTVGGSAGGLGRHDVAGGPGVSPAQARQRFRAGLQVPTSGWAPGYAQANMLAVPAAYAFDVLLFATRNPRACPVLDVTDPGDHRTTLARDADLRTDLPAYRVFSGGEMVAEVTDARPYWRDDLVTFLTGCSFSFEHALTRAGIGVRHTELGRNVPMYVTARPCRPAGRIGGQLVVSMRPVAAADVSRAVGITARYAASHGAPVHVGAPADLGITDLAVPDFGDPPQLRDGELPLFWACGVTLQLAVMRSRLPLAITHAPGHMFISDQPDEQ